MIFLEGESGGVRDAVWRVKWRAALDFLVARGARRSRWCGCSHRGARAMKSRAVNDLGEPVGMAFDDEERSPCRERPGGASSAPFRASSSLEPRFRLAFHRPVQVPCIVSHSLRPRAT